MKKKSKIYLAGHKGLVGSAVMRLLKQRGFKNVIVKSRIELDLMNQAQVEKFFAMEKPEYVIHAAGKVGGIKPNITFPTEFLYENLMITSNIIWSAHRHEVKKLLYVSCACSYPTHASQPIKEAYLLTGIPEPTNEGLAIAKIAGIKLCEKIAIQYKKNFTSCIPCNAYGENDHFEEAKSHVISALIKRFHEAKLSGQKEITLWGTGVAKREFIYGDDLAAAILLLMERYDDPSVINIGSGTEVSIKTLAGLIKKTVGYQGKLLFDPTKPDGMLRRFLDSSQIQKLGFTPRMSLEEGLQKSYQYYLTTL